MPRFGANPYAAPAATPTPAASAAAPAIPAARPAGRFGSNPYSSLLTPAGQQQALTAASVLQSAQAKLKAGRTLTKAEVDAIAAVEGDRKALGNVVIALPTLFAISDVVKGVASDVKDDVTSGRPFTHTAGGNTGMAAAAAHLTYGLSEYLPGMTGAREHGVTGLNLLKGTPYEGNAKAALVVELLSDPTIVLTGAGLVAKAGSMSVKVAQGAGFLDRMASTAEGANFLRNVVQTADRAGTKLIRAGDALTGVPAVARAVAGSGFGQAVDKAVGDLGQTTLPTWWQDKLGVRTVGDAFYHPDVKAATYTPPQQQVQSFRDGQKIAQGNASNAIVAPAQKDIKTVAALTKGLKPADSNEVLRLFTVSTTATDPAIMAEALRKINVIGARVGKDLEAPYVAAVKAANSIRQDNLGNKLADLHLPAVTDPVVNKAYQQATTGQDIVDLTGKYQTQDGRPVGIIPTQYKGRGEVDKVIADLSAAPPAPANVRIDAPKLTLSLNDAASTVPVPARPLPPVGRAADGAPPINPAETATKVTDTLVNVSPPAARALTTPPTTVRSPAEVIDELYGSGAAKDLPSVRSPIDPVNVAPPRVTGEAPPLPVAPIRAAEGVPTPAPTSAVVAPRPAEAVPRVSEVDTPTPDPAINSAADLGTVGGKMASGFSDSMYDMLHGKYLVGDTTELNRPSNILIGAQQLKAAGTALTREQFPDFAQQFIQKLTATSGAPDRQTQLQQFLKEYTPPEVRDAPPESVVTPGPGSTPSLGASPSLAASAQPAGPAGLLNQMLEQGALNLPVTSSKTLAEIIMELASPSRTDPIITPQAAITRTAQSDLKPAALVTPSQERLVTKAVPTTYRTVQVDSSAIDWASLPDAAARREVSNTIGNGFALKLGQDSRWVPNKATVTLPLDHPVVSRYLPNDAIEGARFGGSSGYGELTQNVKAQVPNWYNPKDPAPLDAQRAAHEAEVTGQAQVAYPTTTPGSCGTWKLSSRTHWTAG